MDAVLNWLWQGGVVAAASFVMLFALHRAGANVRCRRLLGRVAADRRPARASTASIDNAGSRARSFERRPMRLSRCPTPGGRRRS